MTGCKFDHLVAMSILLLTHSLETSVCTEVDNINSPVARAYTVKIIRVVQLKNLSSIAALKT